MKTKLTIMLAALVILAGAGMSAARAATNDVSALLQKGLFEEEANRNLEAAIQAYQAVVTQTDKDRQFAATAIFRLGECYRKLGKTNEANVHYQRILRDFPDQTELAKLSRTYAAFPTADTATSVGSGAVIPPDPETQELGRLQTLLKDSPDLINERDSSGRTKLHVAVERKRRKVVQFLLDNKITVDTKDFQGKLPLLIAIERGDKEMVELLLKGGADANSSTSLTTSGQFLGYFPLHFAAYHGHKSIAEALLASGAKMSAKTQDGRTALHLASTMGFKSVVELLVAKGAEVDSRTIGGQTPLDLAILAGNRIIVEYLLASKADVNSRNITGFTPLMYAVGGNNLDIARLLIESGADIKAGIVTPGRNGKCTALHQAANMNQSEMVKLLIEKGADPNETVESFRSSVPNQDFNHNPGTTPLFLTLFHGGTETAKVLIDGGAKVNAQDATGQTPLMLAVRRADRDMVPLLLTNRADPNLQDIQGNTALTLMPINPGVQGTEEITAMLLKAGANENVQRLTTISVTRKIGSPGQVVFYKGTNSLNRFTVFELLASHYGPPNWRPNTTLPGLTFPDFAKIRISRLEKDVRTNVIMLNLSGTNQGGTSDDVPLEWGDIVEIPEREHNLNETWLGLPEGVTQTLSRLLERKVDIAVKGQPIKVTLRPVFPRFNIASTGTQVRTELGSFWLNEVVRGANVLLTSSDLSRVKVKRVDPATSKTVEMLFDLTKNDKGLWLRDGDVIEVPEKTQ